MFDRTFAISGVYCIKNIVNGKVYIGSAVNIRNRWYKHLRLLRKSEHPNVYLQNAWDKYSESNFIFKILKRDN